MHWHYVQHDPSGEVYAISIGENGMFGDICGPLERQHRTEANLVDGYWGGLPIDEDDQAWMGSQSWQLVAPANPDCDCPRDLVCGCSAPTIPCQCAADPAFSANAAG